MPFKIETFQNNIALRLNDPVKSRIIQACANYATLTGAQEKTRSIHDLMELLDREVDVDTRQAVMRACGHRCIGSSVIEKARRLQADARDLDDMLERLNQAHIGGGHLRRSGEAIHATYERCYCGSVSKTRQTFSATYCHCSCGWYQKLFETLLDRHVEVKLLQSIIQGDDNCQFLIHIQDGS